MCTLTVVPLPGRRVRVAFNRDEQRTRPAGLPPTVWAFGDRRAVLPTDPQSGGTWLAVNDAGLVLAVLNVNQGSGVRGQKIGEWPSPTPDPRLPSSELSPDPCPLTPARSRGHLIPALLDCDSPADALVAFERHFTCPDFAPFRLVLIGRGILADVRWDGRESMVMSRLLGGTPLLFTSSGLGDHRVEGVRRDLFDQHFDAPSVDWPRVQDEFHRHRWPGRGHLSVNMERADARTVSHAVIETGDDGATFRYLPEPFDSATETVVTLPPADAR